MRKLGYVKEKHCCISIPVELHKFVKDNKINLSKLVREAIEKLKK